LHEAGLIEKTEAFVGERSAASSLGERWTAALMAPVRRRCPPGRQIAAPLATWTIPAAAALVHARRELSFAREIEGGPRM